MSLFSEIHVHCPGQPGHGSLLLPNTAGEKVEELYRLSMEKFQEICYITACCVIADTIHNKQIHGFKRTTKENTGQ